MSAEQEILREVNEGLAFGGISVVPRSEAEIYKVSEVFGFDVFIVFGVEPFGTVCFSNNKEKYFYKYHKTNPILLNGSPSKEMDKKIKDWLLKKWADFRSAFGDAACEETPSRIEP